MTNTIETADIRNSLYNGPERDGCNEHCVVCYRPLLDGAKSTRYLEIGCGGVAAFYTRATEAEQDNGYLGFLPVGPHCAKLARSWNVSVYTDRQVKKICGF